MANLWDNPSIESGVTDWSGKGGSAITQSSTQAWHGTYSARCAPAADTWSGIESTFKQIVDPSTQYTASLYIYPTASVSLTFEVDGNAYDWLGASTGTHSTDTWTRVSVTFTTDGDHDSVQLKVFKNNSADTNYFYIDGVQLETGASATIWEDYSSATQIDCTVGTVAVSGNNFDISSGASSPIDMTLGAVSIGANNFTISANIVINMSPPGSTVGWDVGAYIYESSGTTLITGYSFDISASESSQMSLGEVVVSGNGFDINSETVVNMLLAALAVASNAFALNSETFVNATLGTVSVAGNTFKIISDGNANMTLGEIVVSGNDFTIESESFIDMSAGTISALGKKFTITRTDVGPGGVIGGGVSSVRIKMTLIL